MSHILLISCVKTKRAERVKAQDLYTSDLFRKWWAYGQTLRPDRVYILSAEHGLVEPEQEIAPYEKTLNRLPVAEVRAWAARVVADLRLVADVESDRFTFLAGARYRRFLTPHLRHVSVPLANMGNGRQLSFMKAALTA